MHRREILQPLVRDYVVGVDLIICGTDTNHSRTAISELAYRYLVPAIDVGVAFESRNGSVTGEIGRLTFYSPSGPCAHCLGLVDPWRATVELMSEEEKDHRRREAKEAELRGDNAGAYWKDVPEIPDGRGTLRQWQARLQPVMRLDGLQENLHHRIGISNSIFSRRIRLRRFRCSAVRIVIAKQ